MIPEGAPRDDDREVHERLALPLLIPAVVFLFAVLVIYGLSRIYLELHEWEYRDVSMATPAAIGVALAILFVSTYLASRRTVSRVQIAFIMSVGAALLTGGAIWAAVHEDKGTEGQVVGSTPTVPAGGTPIAGAMQVELLDGPFAVTTDPPSTAAGSVAFSVTNAGTIPHNLRVILTDLEQDALPLDSATFSVDESQLDVVASTDDLPAGRTEDLTEDLEAGAYVLLCNVPTHYQSGMHTAFTVE
jgi:uncharacterized cupredoxin-like copper-binding protein